MTNEEAKRILYVYRAVKLVDASHREAFDMAIEELEQEPCEDAISRASVCETYSELYDEFDDNRNIQSILHRVYDNILSLPSVQPEPKVGEWLEKEVNSDKVIEEWQSARCSVCDKYHTTPYMYYFDNYKFCPNCGARMEASE